MLVRVGSKPRDFPTCYYGYVHFTERKLLTTFSSHREE